MRQLRAHSEQNLA